MLECVVMLGKSKGLPISQAWWCDGLGFGQQQKALAVEPPSSRRLLEEGNARTWENMPLLGIAGDRACS